MLYLLDHILRTNNYHVITTQGLVVQDAYWRNL